MTRISVIGWSCYVWWNLEGNEMTCPTCNRPYGATDVKCLHCGTTLIYEAEGHSKAYKQAENTMDSKMFAGIGALLGFFFTVFLLKFVLTSLWISDRQIFIAATIAGVVGSVIGRFIQRNRLNA
jgi:hypothetical protein